MYKIFLVFTLLFAAGNCEKTQASSQNTRTVYIGSTLKDCMGLAPQKCMLYRESTEEKWTFFYDRIAGFDYQEGYNYQLKIKVTPVAEPLADASSLLYTLIEVISKEKAPIETAVSTVATQEQSFAAFVYEEFSRGFYKRIEVTPGAIALFKEREGSAERSIDCKKTLWTTMQTMATNTNPETISKLVPPSTDFSSDRGAHASLTIKTADKTYTSSTFDSGNPPEEIKALVAEITALESSLTE